MHAKDIYIEKNYCIEHYELNASFFGYAGKDDFPIVSIPQERTYYSVPSTQVTIPFMDKNISVIDSSEGVVIFKRNCKMMGKQDEILAAFFTKLQEDYPYIKIENKPTIFIKSTLPSDFNRYQLISVMMTDSSLKKSSGSFIGVFKVGNREKKIYFYYTLKATVDVFKAKHNLHNGKILLDDDYEKVSIDLDELPSRAILNDMSSTMVMKGYVKEGQILTEMFLDIKKDVNKRDSIKAYLKEGSLVIEVQATVLEDANIGDSVKIKTEQGKVLNAKIISNKQAMILE